MNMNLLIYFIIINSAAFIFFITGLVHRGAQTEGKLDVGCTILAFAGGGIGQLAAMCITDRRMSKENAATKVFVICAAAIWCVVILFAYGPRSEKLTFDLVGFFGRNMWLMYYLGAMCIIELILFAWDKFCAMKEMMRISIAVLLLVSFAGGSVGALIGMVLFHHKNRKIYFYAGVPFTIIAQLAVIFYLMNSGQM